MLLLSFRVPGNCDLVLISLSPYLLCGSKLAEVVLFLILLKLDWSAECWNMLGIAVNSKFNLERASSGAAVLSLHGISQAGSVDGRTVRAAVGVTGQIGTDVVNWHRRGTL